MVVSLVKYGFFHISRTPLVLHFVYRLKLSKVLPFILPVIGCLQPLNKALNYHFRLSRSTKNNSKKICLNFGEMIVFSKKDNKLNGEKQGL